MIRSRPFERITKSVSQQAYLLDPRVGRIDGREAVGFFAGLVVDVLQRQELKQRVELLSCLA
ncbi:hypothetical protein [Pararhodobacter sp. SW119]|uniref:hypothetical protein n=1 Tax=Pararhodobacter sp. SW119 TaxID=2780075 RepID=UPI001ADFC9DD|nr:hypothetical protein [Pararhodobacter sp. SW119]